MPRTFFTPQVPMPLTCEVITAETTLEDELEFLDFVCRDPRVRLLQPEATLSGLLYLSIDDICELKRLYRSNLRLFLWLTGTASPLCWRLYLYHYGRFSRLLAILGGGKK